MRCRKCKFEFEYHVYLGQRCPKCGSRVSSWRVVRQALRPLAGLVGGVLFMLLIALGYLIARLLQLRIEGGWNVFLAVLPCVIVAAMFEWWLRREDNG